MNLYMETTQANVGKTVSDIQRVLSLYGATAVLVDYVEKEPDGISFKIPVGSTEVPFRLPCRWTEVFKILSRRRIRVRDAEKLKDQARRVAWRQILRWVEAQLALVSTGMVKTEEVFMPYIQLSPRQTFFEHLQSQGWKFKQLTQGEE